MLEQIPHISKVKANTSYLPKLNFVVKAKDVTTSVEQVEELLDVQMHNVKKLGFISKEAQAIRDIEELDYAKQAILMIDGQLKKRGIQVLN